MNRRTKEASDSVGVLAFGSSSNWDVSVDEFHEDEGWLIEIDGRDFYVVFHAGDKTVVAQMIAFLRRGLECWHQKSWIPEQFKHETLVLGRFSSAKVSLFWDTEDFLRCVLLIGAKSHSAMRFSLYEKDIEGLVDALEQVSQELE
jgi:hypothetical protein